MTVSGLTIARALTLSVLLCGSAVVAQESSAGDPVDVLPLLEQAAVDLVTGRPRDALARLEQVERQEPNNPWLWFYRGSSYLALRQGYRAMEALDRAAEILQSHNQPDPALARRVREVRADARRRVFNLSFAAGFAYDTNVTFLSGGAATMDLIAGEDDGKFGTRARLDFSPIDDGTFALTFGARVAHSWHFDIDSFDFQDYGGYARLAYRPADSWEVAAQYDYDFMLLGNQAFLSSHALTASLMHEWGYRNTIVAPMSTTVFYRYEDRDFRFAVDDAFDRDGDVHSVGVSQAFRVRPILDSAWAARVDLGYRFDRVTTDGTEFDRHTHSFQIGAVLPLVKPWQSDEYLLIPDKELQFRFDVEWLIGDYDNRSLIDANRGGRSDLVTTYGLTVSQTLMDDPDDGRLVLHGIFQWTDAVSDVRARGGVSPFSYDKYVYGLQFEWSW